MGRIDGISATTVNDKPNLNQVLEPNNQSTGHFVHVSKPEPESEPEPEPEPQQQQQSNVGQQHINIHINVPQVTNHVQPPVPQYPTHGYPVPPQYHPPQPPQPQGWTTGLFDCLDDPINAIITLFCPCVTFGQIAERIDNRRTSCEVAGCIYGAILVSIAIPCIYSCTYRTKLRCRFGLDEDPASDCLTHLCCELCALCQEYRELDNRGFSPSAGWLNQNTQQQGMVPPTYQHMG